MAVVEKDGRLQGANDVDLYKSFSEGSTPRGTRLIIESPRIKPDDEKGQKAEVILLQSVAQRTGSRPMVEHLVLSDDNRVESMVLRGVTHWEVIGHESEEQLTKRGEELALDKHGS